VISIPGYRIIRELGRGGMATVWLAVQESVDREVALKLLSPQLLVDPTFGERFQREARIAARLHHRHIVAVYDVGVHGQTHYTAMEYLSGGPVMPDRTQPIEPRRALRCVREVAEALDYAHSKGFIHRDVKPDNILLRDDGSCVLCDFGIARAATAATQMTKTGSVVGTPYYMSPEQLRGMPLDGRADLYSLGVVLYHLLSGDVPYRASDSLAVGIMHMTAPLPRLPASLTALQPLLDRMLAKEAADRVQTGAEVMRLVQALERRREWASDEVGEAPTLKVPSATRRVEPVPEPPSRVAPPAKATPRSDLPRGTDRPTGRSEPAMGLSPIGPEPRIQMTAVDPEDDPLADLGPRRTGSMKAAGTRTEPVLAGLPETDDLYAARRRQPAPRRSVWPWLLALTLLAGSGAAAWTWPQWGPPLLDRMRGADQTDPRVRARMHMDAGRWFAADGDDALSAWLTVQATEPKDPEVRAGLERVRRELVGQVQALAASDPTTARAIETRLRTAFPDDPAVVALRGVLAAARPVAEPPAPAPARPAPAPAPTAAPARPSGTAAASSTPDWLTQATDAENAGRWYEGSGSALDLYLSARGAGNTAEAVQIGIDRNLRRLSARVGELVEGGRRADARSLLEPFVGREPVAARVAELLVQLDAAEAGQRRAGEVARLLEQATQAESRRQYTSPPESSALTRYRAVLELEPDNAAAKDGMARIAGRLLDDAEQAIRREQYDMARRLLTQASSAGAPLARVRTLEQQLESATAPPLVQTLDPAAAARLEVALEGFDRALRAGELLDPPGDSAYDRLRAALAIDRNDPRVQEASARLAAAFREPILSAARNGRLKDALDLMNDLRGIEGGNSSFLAVRNEVAELLIERARRAFQAGDVAAATQAVNGLRSVHATHAELRALERQLAAMR
jgi:serine/threonine protein kinase